MDQMSEIKKQMTTRYLDCLNQRCNFMLLLLNSGLKESEAQSECIIWKRSLEFSSKSPYKKSIQSIFLSFIKTELSSRKCKLFNQLHYHHHNLLERLGPVGRNKNVVNILTTRWNYSKILFNMSILTRKESGENSLAILKSCKLKRRDNDTFDVKLFGKKALKCVTTISKHSTTSWPIFKRNCSIRHLFSSGTS